MCPEDNPQKFQEVMQKVFDDGVEPLKSAVDEYGGDVEFYTGKMHHEYWVDGIPRAQGISIVYSATGGAALHRLLLRGGYKQSWLNILLGLAACYPIYSNVYVYLKVGNDRNAGGQQVSHLGHAVGVLLGAAVSWWKP